MKKIIFLLTTFLLLSSFPLFSQTFQKEIEEHREKYKREFLEDEKAPLKKEDLAYLKFYKPDPSYKVKGHFTRLVDTIGFDMQTHNGVIKKYYVYGFVTFPLKKQTHKLFVYQSEKLRTKEGFEDYLFIPFTDNTNYKETFGGGRYMDFRFSDIVNGSMTIDFNKCYNPYCAYKEGYACPIPPKENDLKISIPVGEKLFAGEIKEASK